MTNGMGVVRVLPDSYCVNQSFGEERVLVYEGLGGGVEPPPYCPSPVFEFSDEQRAELAVILNVHCNPYTHYPDFLAEIKKLVERGLPRYMEDLRERLRVIDKRRNPIVVIKNCPIGYVPDLDYDRPLESKYEKKKDFVAEAFHSVYAEMLGAAPVAYRNANRGDMFQDITPMRQLANSITQRTLDTLHFHFDLPDHKVRPDWVYLLGIVNSPANKVYTPVVRLTDVFDRLSVETIDQLKRPIYAQPLSVFSRDIPNYGMAEAGYRSLGPLLIERGGELALMYFEGCHTGLDELGVRAIEELRGVLHKCKYNLFIGPGDFVAISNFDSMHARHVERVDDIEAHKKRWLLKAWVVSDVNQHIENFDDGRLHTSNE